ncbi:MAG: right-handed parallel beta-helix repeat-containing protein [Clostridia bacterium]|jgi:hypothetical protein|nr:right-handed parallel beta-helix repeat-containing protein [Clostridia bacterium]
MKKILAKSVTVLMAALLACGLAACSKSTGTLSSKPNEGISAGTSEAVASYAHTAYYELERPADVKISFETNKIQKLSFKYKVLGDDDWSYKNDVITVKKKVFADETAGDKRLRVFVDNAYTEITVRVVTKVVKTPEDFDSIRNNLNGVYVLGNDIDFGNRMFWPIGKSVSESGNTKPFEGVFDGMGYAVKNVTVQALDYATGEDGQGQGPSLGSVEGNGRNYNNGIFMTTSSNAKIINTDFVNITVNCQGLGGAVAGSNGGLIKNCRVTCTLSHKGYAEHSAGIAGINAGGDSAGRIENCIVVYTATGGGSRGIADWNSGTIRNCYAAVADDYVLHVAYDPDTQKVPADFDYDEFFTQDNFEAYGFGNYTLPAFPGAVSWVDGKLAYYKSGDIIRSDVVRKEFLLDPANFSAADGWDEKVWNFSLGAYPSLRPQSM